MGNDSHGQISDGLNGFVRLLDANTNQPSVEALKALAFLMVDRKDEPKDEPDPEENLMIPAGYTYFGQFIDHDLTFDVGTSLDDVDASRFRSARSPRFDLDCVYGAGPDVVPFMYEGDKVHLRVGKKDLLRVVTGRDGVTGQDILGRAIIGDPRNDENSIVCNLQMRFIEFHNMVADRLVEIDPSLKRDSKAWFRKAQREVRWTYQVIVARDFLRRLIKKTVLDDFNGVRQPDGKELSTNSGAYKLFPVDKRGAIPLEFAGAAYRYGHSMVRTGYRLNAARAPLSIFDGTNDPTNSLVGFTPLPEDHVIDNWDLFFPGPVSSHKSKTPGVPDDLPTDPNEKGAKRLQFSYRIDTTVVDPLAHLPPAIFETGPTNLAERNLLRGRVYQLPTGQQVASALGVPALPAGSIQIRTKLRRVTPGDDASDWVESFFAPKEALPIAAARDDLTDEQKIATAFTGDLDQFLKDTPLWFYVLAEAQQDVFKWWLERGAGEFTEGDLSDNAGQTTTQLGSVGGRIVAEVFHGLLDSDEDSYRNGEGGQSWLQGDHLIQDFTLWHLVNLQLKAKA